MRSTSEPGTCQGISIAELALFTILTIFLIVPSAVAQTLPQPTAPNGCGTGWNRYFVPDSIPLFQCQFKSCCDNHDVCYGKCESSVAGVCEYRRCRNGGDLFGKDFCMTDERMLKLQVMANVRRKQCDSSFYTDLRAANPGKMVCAAFAVVYREAVKEFGGDAFIGAERFDGPPQSQADYEAAIREFFRSGSEEQFKRLVEGADAGNPVVNLKKDIRFSRTSGLTNAPH